MASSRSTAAKGSSRLIHEHAAMALIMSTRAPFFHGGERGAAPRHAGRIVEGADQFRPPARLKTSASRWSQAWLPSVIASAPASQKLIVDGFP